jgi:exosortase/archaeosortase family protein
MSVNFAVISGYILQNKQQLLRLLFILLLIIWISFFGWSYITSTNAYGTIVLFLTDITGHITSALTLLTRDSATYNSASGQLISSSQLRFSPVMPVGAYFYYIIAFTLLLAVPIKKLPSALILALSTVVFIVIRAALITYIRYQTEGHLILLSGLEPLIYFPFIVIIWFVLTSNSFLAVFYQYLQKLFEPHLIISINKLVVLLLLLTPVPRIIMTYFNSASPMNALTKFTLEISRVFLELLGYLPHIETKLISLDRFWIQLEHPCLGVGVFTIIAILIGSTKSPLINKLLYIPLAFVAMTAMNSIRLSLLLIYLQSARDNMLDLVTLHDYATYFMYAVAFALYILYVYLIQDIKLSFTKKITKKDQNHTINKQIISN